MTTDPAVHEVDARGMRCPWPALRAARALRTHIAVLLHADDPVAPQELAAMAVEQGWFFEIKDKNLFFISRKTPLRENDNEKFT